MTPISLEYDPVVRAEHPHRLLIPQIEMQKLVAEARLYPPRPLPGCMFLETGYYWANHDTRLVTSETGIIVSKGNADIMKVVPTTVFWLQHLASDYERFSGVKLEFDLEKFAVVLTPAGEQKPFRLDPGILCPKYPKSPEISTATSKTIFSLMLMDQKLLGQIIYDQIRELGIVLVNKDDQPGTSHSIIEGFALTGKRLKDLGKFNVDGVAVEDNVVYSFDNTLAQSLLLLGTLKRFQPVVVFVTNHKSQEQVTKS